jgi:glycosyltransferase involved in cell wall biosynthesis
MTPPDWTASAPRSSGGLTVRISVALCTWNGEAHLEAQLDSILGQQRPPDQVIACDDASDDDSAAILSRFAARAPFDVRVVVNGQRLGVTANFAQAIARCDGDWIALCDQDDVWHPDKLAVIERAIAGASGAGLVFTNAQLIDAAGRDTGRTLWEGFGLSARKRERFLRGEGIDVLLERNVVTGAAMAFASRHRDVLLPIPGPWIHDAWIALLIAAMAPIIPVNACAFSYRQHDRNQIGVADRGVSARVAHARDMPRSDYRLQADRIRSARDRLRAHGQIDERVIAKLVEKVAHAESRAALPSSRLRRLPSIMAELLSGRYSRYSSGPFSAVRDFLLS